MTDPVDILDQDVGGLGEWLAAAGDLTTLPVHMNTQLPILPVPHYWGLGMKTDPPPGKKIGYYLSVTKSDTLPPSKLAEVYVGPSHPGFDEMKPSAMALLEALRGGASA